MTPVIARNQPLQRGKFNLKRHTDELAEEVYAQFEYAHCPTCQADHRVYRDKLLMRYFYRHLQAGRSTNCRMSVQAVKD